MTDATKSVSDLEPWVLWTKGRRRNYQQALETGKEQWPGNFFQTYLLLKVSSDVPSAQAGQTETYTAHSLSMHRRSITECGVRSPDTSEGPMALPQIAYLSKLLPHF